MFARNLDILGYENSNDIVNEETAPKMMEKISQRLLDSVAKLAHLSIYADAETRQKIADFSKRLIEVNPSLEIKKINYRNLYSKNRKEDENNMIQNLNVTNEVKARVSSI